MPHGSDLPTSSSTSPTVDAGSREQPARPLSKCTRQGRYEIVRPLVDGDGEHKQPQSLGRHTKSAPLDDPNRSDEIGTSRPARKAPLYLQGKNPYGRVLVDVKHPYHRPEITTGPTLGSASQTSTNAPGKSRETGNVHTGARPPPIELEPGRTSTTSNPPPPPLPPRQIRKQVSVQAVKNFFETKAAQNRSEPPLPPASATIAAAGVTVKNPRSLVSLQHQSARAPNPAKTAKSITLTAPPNSAPPSLEPYHVTEATTTSIIDHSHRPASRGSSEETVRRNRPPSSPLPKDAEASEDSRKLEAAHEPHNAGITHASSQTIGESDTSVSYSGFMADFDRNNDQAVRIGRRSSFKSSSINIDTSQSRVSKSNNVRLKVEAIAARGLSHDGLGSLYSLSQQSTTSHPVTIADVGVQDDYHSFEVPEHVDWREAYGRRRMQDFGFSGACVKPRITYRRYKPLQDAAESTTPLKPQHNHFRRRRRKDPATESFASVSSSSRSSKGFGARTPQHRKSHSECIPADKCGDTFAKDLGVLIDSILEEHSSTLQGVINNIRRSQPNLAHLRRMSQDLVQRSQTTDVYTNPHHTICLMQCNQKLACQLVNQQTCQRHCEPQVCQWTPSIPYVPPKVTQKLNVGSPGQTLPNVNDGDSTLRETIKSVPELVSLINSAADDLGLDLDRRPTAKDDELFQAAPVETTP
ncbi:hypothetical protein NX059_005344 [Plenodomus lindquistii]|nr:hypothetical protein NX059_005344 [Plenodomus lindquistii]